MVRCDRSINTAGNIFFDEMAPKQLGTWVRYYINSALEEGGDDDTTGGSSIARELGERLNRLLIDRRANNGGRADVEEEEDDTAAAHHYRYRPVLEYDAMLMCMDEMLEVK